MEKLANLINSRHESVFDEKIDSLPYLTSGKFSIREGYLIYRSLITESRALLDQPVGTLMFSDPYLDVNSPNFIKAKATTLASLGITAHTITALTSHGAILFSTLAKFLNAGGTLRSLGVMIEKDAAVLLGAYKSFNGRMIPVPNTYYTTLRGTQICTNDKEKLLSLGDDIFSFRNLVQLHVQKELLDDPSIKKLYGSMSLDNMVFHSSLIPRRFTKSSSIDLLTDIFDMELSAKSSIIAAMYFMAGISNLGELQDIGQSLFGFNKSNVTKIYNILTDKEKSYESTSV